MDITSPRQVGRSKLNVTPLGFGGGTIGSPQVSNEDALSTVRAAWDTGVRFFDTAPWYGVGRSERRLGMALAGVAGVPPPRASYRINSKVGKTLDPEPVRDDTRSSKSPGGQPKTIRDPLSGFRVSFNYSYDNIMGQHRDSLQRLGHSRVDSLTIHDIDYGYHTNDEIEGHLRQLSRAGGGGANALEELRDQGLISAIGCGCNLESRNAFSWEDSRHEDLCERILDTVDLDFFVVAGGYTLLETRALRRILPLCEAKHIGVIIAAPYASGWLVSPDENATYMYGQPPEDIVIKSQHMHTVCADFNVPLAAVAIQFTLAHPSVAAVIPGAKAPQEAQDNLQHLATDVPEALWARLKSEGLLNPDAPTPD